MTHAMLKLAMQEVLGDDTTSAPLWRWLGVAALLLLAVWTAGWLLGKYTVGTAMLSSPWVDLERKPDAIELSAQDPVVRNSRRAAGRADACRISRCLRDAAPGEHSKRNAAPCRRYGRALGAVLISACARMKCVLMRCKRLWHA